MVLSVDVILPYEALLYDVINADMTFILNIVVHVLIINCVTEIQFESIYIVY